MKDQVDTVTIESSLAEGAAMIWKRKGLVFLLYSINVLVALVIALPIFTVLYTEVGITGFGVDLIEAFDLILWREILAEMGAIFDTLSIQILVLIPLYWLWKTASQVGLIYALHNGAIWPFWRGVFYYLLPALGLGLLYLPLKVLWIALMIWSARFFHVLWPGAVGGFWVWGVLIPILILSGLAVLEIYQRYGRMALVIKHDTLWNAIGTGIHWAGKYKKIAGPLFLTWYGIALVIWMVSMMLNAELHVGFEPVILGFIIQQVSMIARSAVSVGWVGSEVCVFQERYQLEFLGSETATLKPAQKD